MPALFFKENNKVYTFEGAGGEREYCGLDAFKNIEITSASITATLKNKTVYLVCNIDISLYL